MGLFDLFKAPKEKETETNKPSLTWVDSMNEENVEKKEKILLDIEKNPSSIIDLHFTYNLLIDLYYKQRNERTDALAKCEEYCKKDIHMYPEFEKAYSEDEMRSETMPRCPSFQRIVILYEKQGNIREAIYYCELAIKYGQTDDTKGGYEGRLKKLHNKIRN